MVEVVAVVAKERRTRRYPSLYEGAEVEAAAAAAEVGVKKVARKNVLAVQVRIVTLDVATVTGVPPEVVSLSVLCSPAVVREEEEEG